MHDGGSVSIARALNDCVPVFVAIIRKLFRVTVPIGFPIESLKHDTVIFEASLAQNRRCAAKTQRRIMAMARRHR